jgi:Heavy metal binding domain
MNSNVAAPRGSDPEPLHVHRRKFVDSLVGLFALITLAGCATNFEAPVLPSDHPANIDAQEAPRPAIKRLSDADELTRKTKTQLAREATPEHAYPSDEMDHNTSAMAGPAPVQPNDQKAESPSARAIYTCVMHPEVVQSTPGNCPKCGMSLVKKTPSAP